MTSSSDPSRLRVLFAASSPSSGSTLLPFLLNAHPAMTGIGHTIGWHYADDEEYLCSCGASLPECPLYRAIAQDQRAAGHPFEYQDFGFDYRLATNERLNRLLTTSFPFLRNSSLERLRDGVIRCVPGWRQKFQRVDRANEIFVKTTLEFSGADIFVDGHQDPYRLRHLRHVPGIDISIVHLIRDVRGVVFSNMVKKGWGARVATLNWLNQQANILRITSEFPRTLTVFYESLCDETGPTLESIHRFVGVEPMSVGGNFKQGEHHIIGNKMRLGDGKIVRSRRWEAEMSVEDRRVVEETCRQYARESAGSGVAKFVEHYLAG